MNTEQTWQIESENVEHTFRIAAAIGSGLRGGEVFELVSDLGGGKTAFVRGLVQGMGSKDDVRSPSFTISNQYNAGDMMLYHFDFYRLDDPGLMRDELEEFIQDPQVVTAIEWSDNVQDILPIKRIRLELTPISENGRKLDFIYDESLAYLFEELSLL